MSEAYYDKVTPIILSMNFGTAVTGYDPKDLALVAFLDHALAFWREQLRLLTIEKIKPMTYFISRTTSVAAECFALMQTLDLADGTFTRKVNLFAHDDTSAPFEQQ